VLHTALREAVDAAGVAVVPSPVHDVVQTATGIHVDGTAARYLIAADGLHSPVRRELRMQAPVGRRRRFGLRSHAAIAPWTDHVEVHWSPTAEAYITPVGPDLVGIALLTSVRVAFDQQLQGFPAVRERLVGSAMSQVRGAGPLRQRSRRRVAGRVLLVGDASGYVDALTGEGISLGMAQARAAVAAIRADQPLRYESAWRHITWRYRLLTGSLLGASRLPPVRRAIVPAASALPWVFAAAVNELARPA
jgi:flavin-dependent dehydrogenase